MWTLKPKERKSELRAPEELYKNIQNIVWDKNVDGELPP